MLRPKLLLPLLAAALTLVSVPSASAASHPAHATRGVMSTATTDWRLLVNFNSGKCANVPQKSTSNGTALIQYTCDSTATNEIWGFEFDGGVPGWYFLKNQHSGLCMNVKGASLSNGAPVIQYTCGAAKANDVWYLSSSNYSGYYYLINDYSGKCLNVQGASTANGAALVQYTCGASQKNDLWYFK
jgi:hypothetical protein